MDPRSAFFVLCMLAGFATVANAFFRDKILSAKDSIINGRAFRNAVWLIGIWSEEKRSDYPARGDFNDGNLVEFW